MAASTISVSGATRKRLMMLKIEEGSRSMDELLVRMLVEYRKARLRDASAEFRRRLAETGVSLEDLIS